MRSRGNSRDNEDDDDDIVPVIDLYVSEDDSPYAVGTVQNIGDTTTSTSTSTSTTTTRPSHLNRNGHSPSVVPGRPRRRLKRKMKPSKLVQSRSSSRNKNQLSLFLNKFYIKYIRSNDEKKNGSSFSGNLIVAVILWYSLGVISISTSKVLLTPSPHLNPNHPRYYRHVGGVAPLVLTLQQLLLGSTFLRLLLRMRFLGSVGLQPYSSILAATSTSSTTSATTYTAMEAEISSPRPLKLKRLASNDATSILETARLLWQTTHTRQLILAGLCFTLGFGATNLGFSGTSASFVETVKAAEPITSAMLAVSYGLEVLTHMEVASLSSIIAGVLLSTLGNTASSSSSSSSSFYESIYSCVIVMASNLCFSFRGLYQKLFRKTAGANAVDDLNLQFRMQQLGVLLLIIPTIIWEGPSVISHVYHVLTGVGGIQQSIMVGLKYMLLAMVNGFCFTSYNLASTYLLSRISVVHHAALNCIRRIFAILVTSAVFGVPITLVSALGIVASVAGFMAFTYAKAQKNNTPKPLSSLLPLTSTMGDHRHRA